jgi:delta-aminolevulinic acid dehydratase/porphobilinogen synthase
MSAIVSTKPASITAKDRAQFVSSRLQEISKSMAEYFIETGQLLKEYKDNGYYKEEGYDSFDQAIEQMHQDGKLDFGSRNARNLIGVVEMALDNGLKPADLEGISISKLRELATLPKEAQKKTPVAEIQAEAKKIRHKARGHDVDPLDYITLPTTATGKTAFNTAIATARRINSIADNVPDHAVLIDVILAEWMSGQETEAESIEAEITARM